jgi:hypothetical protein
VSRQDLLNTLLQLALALLFTGAASTSAAAASDWVIYRGILMRSLASSA